MQKELSIKELLYQQLKITLEQKQQSAKIALDSAIESRDNETKSSAGDKHETGRAMMQIEQARNEAQLRKIIGLKNELQQINIQQISDNIVLGSLVRTTRGNYFLSIGLGKFILREETYYAISTAAPIGQLLLNKKVGDNLTFQEKKFSVKAIE